MTRDPNRPPATGPEWNGSRASDVPVEPGGTPNPLEAKKSNDDPPFDFAPPEDIPIDDDVCADEWMAEAPDEPPTGNGHASGNGHDEPACEDPDEAADPIEAEPGAALEPNPDDINKHLYAIFNPDFVKDYPDAWIEIAIGDPKAPPAADGRKRIGPRASEHFSPFELKKAAAYAVWINRKGKNVYVGMALREGETGRSGRATKDNVVTSSRGWADFDREGDDKRVAEALRQKGIEHSEITITGTIPHPRFQLMIALSKPALAELEVVNEALRDCLGGNGDGVQNCDRVMRLAGTVSWPPPDKAARGYVPELTRLVINKNARAYDPELLVRLLRGNEPRAALGWTGGAAPLGRDTAALAQPERRRLHDAKLQKGTKAYRISSKALGRNLEEDLSISPKGITDWGLSTMPKKSGRPGEEVTASSNRGASAKVDGSRVVRVVNPMSPRQAEEAGVEEHRRYFRTINDKANLAPPADKSDWYKLESVSLGNGIKVTICGIDIDYGDSVGVVVPWEWPAVADATEGVDWSVVESAIAAGKWRSSEQADEDWIGEPIANVLGLDLEAKVDRSKVKKLISTWLKDGRLERYEDKDANWITRPYIRLTEPYARKDTITPSPQNENGDGEVMG